MTRTQVMPIYEGALKSLIERTGLQTVEDRRGVIRVLDEHLLKEYQRLLGLLEETSGELLPGIVPADKVGRALREKGLIETD